MKYLKAIQAITIIVFIFCLMSFSIRFIDTRQKGATIKLSDNTKEILTEDSEITEKQALDVKGLYKTEDLEGPDAIIRFTKLRF